MAYLNDECFSTLAAHKQVLLATISMLYTTSLQRTSQKIMDEHMAVKKSNDEYFRKNCRKEAQLPTVSKTQPSIPGDDFWVKEYVGRRPSCIIVASNCGDILCENVFPVDSDPYRALSTAKQFTTAETNRLLARKLLRPGTAESAVQIVADLKKDRSFRLSVVYRKLDAYTARDT